MKEVERHLGVSYPTARARFDQILVRLGHLEAEDAPPPDATPATMTVLESLAEGHIDVDEALRKLS